MKLTFRLLLLILLPFLSSGCCGDCDEVNDNVLSIQVFEKATKQNITKTLDAATFVIFQAAPEQPVILPKLEFKDNEIVATFPVICQLREVSGTLDVRISGILKERFLINLAAATKNCCTCSQTRTRIKELTPQQGSQVTLKLNANVLKIEI